MERLSISAGVSSPSVEFDAATGVLEIGGESYPENSFEFYSPLIRWLDQYLVEGSNAVHFKVALSYLNTSSTKYMIDILDRLEAAHAKGRSISIEWFYDADNDRARDTIEEFKEDFSMPFAVVPVKE